MEDYKHYRKQNDPKFNKQNKEDNEEIKMLRESNHAYKSPQS